jgi:energy-coupling factor transporter ATP-binding protein EcfA2
MFKIIALEILQKPENLTDREQARYNSIHRVLKPEQIFKFYNDYDISSSVNNEKFDIINSRKEVPDDFYDNKFKDRVGKGKLRISLCAIVGQNGSGKSSVFELAIRIINNLSYAIIGNKTNRVASNNLHFIDNIYARLYFQIEKNGEIINHKIVQFGKRISLYQEGDAKPFFDWNYDQKAQAQKRIVSLFFDFFYTIVVNYSSYSYNIYDMQPEWDDELVIGKNGLPLSDDEQCWLNGIFHKNDAYRTPIVLNPYRNNGLIDFNNERSLSRDRLFLLLLQKDEKGSPIFRELLDGKEAYAFIFDITVASEVQPQKPHVTRDIKNLFEFFRIDIALVDILFKSIITAWSNCYEIDLETCNRDSKDRQQALNYLFYKTIKCVKNYSDFQEYTINLKENMNLDRLVRSLYNNQSHITTKIRRTIAFLIFNHYKTSKENVLIDTFASNMTELIDNQSTIILKLKSKNTYNRKQYVWKFEDLLPSPFINTTINLREINNEDNVMSFNTLSSGEKQMIYSLSSMLYHIKNIDSVWENYSESLSENTVKYRNINLMLDEIELYSHPCYQIKHVKFVLDSLSKLELNNIEAINIIFSTHSPFILSDIPTQNTLLLDKGSTYSEHLNLKNTFGSNFYDILKSGFFISENPIGDFSNGVLNDILKDTKNEKKIIEEPIREKYNKILALVGEPFIKNYLLKELNQK